MLPQVPHHRGEPWPPDCLGGLHIGELFHRQIPFRRISPEQLLLRRNTVAQFLFLARYARVQHCLVRYIACRRRPEGSKATAQVRAQGSSSRTL